MASTATGTIAVGYGRTADNALRAFRWTTTSGTMQDLGLLPGGKSARAWAVSADGTTVVGCAADFKTDIHAFLWTPTLGMVDLNTYMPALGVDRTGWMLESAWAISAVVAGRHPTESARLSLRKTYQSGGFVPVWTGFVTFCLAGLGRPAQAGIVREIPVRGLHRRSIAMSLRNPCQAWLAVGVALACLLAGPARAVTIDMVPVGNPGNANDPATGSLYGAVSYEYQIGKYEVTIQQYTDFLNAVADTDTYSLYNTSMGSFQNSAGITRSGASGSYTYAVSGPFGTNPAGANSPGNRPVTFVNWFDAARFANWMANGQPTGLQTATTTENGAYTLSGATSGTAPARNAINPNTSVATTFWIPTENEWYKAAYYDPTLNSGAGGYYTYATRSNSAPGNTIGSGTNQANYYAGDYAVTQSPSNLSNQNYLTNAGAFTNSASSYGTFDQSGNVWEWNDLTGTAGVNRGLRGGSFNNNAAESSSSQRSAQLATSEGSSGNWGFRVASVPEPSTCAMALAGLVYGGWCAWRRRRGRGRPSAMAATLALGVALLPASPARAAPLSFTSYTTANGLGSDSVYGVYASGGAIYAATAGGMSISTNGGTNWTNYTTTNGLGSNSVRAVFVSGSVIYAATLGGMGISTDGGANWTNRTTVNGLGANDVYDVYVSGSAIYAATGGGLGISTDGGANWTNRTAANGLGVTAVNKVYVSDGTIYAATGGGLGISTDGGANFTNYTTTNGLVNNFVRGVSMGDGSLYVGTSGGMSISTNGGATWTNRTTANGLPNNTVYDVYASGSTVYASTLGGLGISTNGGSIWTTYTTANGLGSNIVLGAYASDGATYVATFGGVGISAVPEPSTYAMTLVGLACGGFLVRRRQRTWTLRRSADPDSSGRRPSFGQSRHSIRSSDLTATTYRQGACS